MVRKNEGKRCRELYGNLYETGVFIGDRCLVGCINNVKECWDNEEKLRKRCQELYGNV